MNWSAVGAIGEIVGAMAVFLTLIYLALQIRQNTKAVQASAVDASIRQVTSVRRSMYESADLAQIYVDGLANPDNLDEESRLRFRLIIHNIFLSISNIYSQTRYADLSLSTWESQIIILTRVATTPGGRWFWQEYRLEFEDVFREQVDSILQAN